MATKSSPLIDFINSLADPRTHKQHSGAVSEIAGDLAQATGYSFLGPQSLPSNVLSSVTGQKIAPYQAPSESAQRGLDLIQGGIVGAPEKISASVGEDIARTALPEIKAAGQKIVKPAAEAIEAAKAQLGGLQAGFAKLPDIPKTGDKVIRDMRYKQGTQSPNVYKTVPSSDLPTIEGPLREPSPLNKIPEAKPKTPPTPQEQLAAMTDARAGRVTPDNPTGKNPVTVTLPAKLSGPRKEKEVQKTLDEFVPGTTPSEVYKNLEDTVGEFGIRINQELRKNPQSAKVDDLMKDYDKNLNSEGIYRQSLSPKDTVRKEARAYLDDIYRTASNEDPATTVPGQLSDQGLYNIRQAITQDLKSVYKKEAAGNTLGDKDLVKLSALQTVDDALSSMHPTAKDYITKQSHLYQAVDSAYEARGAERKALQDEMIKQAKETEKAAQEAAKPKQNLIQKHPYLSTLAGTTLAGAVGYGASTVLPKTLGLMSGVDSNQEESSLDPNAKPRYDIQTPLDDGTLISQQAQAERQGNLEKQAAAMKLTDPIGAAKIEGDIAANEREFAAQEDLRNSAKDSQVVFNTANETAQTLESFHDNGWMNFVSKGYDEMARASGGKYAKLAAELQALEKTSGIPIFGSSPRSKEAFINGLDTLVELQETKMKSVKSAALKKPTDPTVAPQSNLPPIPQQPVNWQQNDPRVNAAMQNLPPIQ